MRIAILAWGSLVPETGSLRIVNNEWHRGGPELPIELSRLSQRRRYLTFVIDETNGRRVPTRYAISTFDRLEGAIANLAERETCPISRIGYVVSENETHRSRTPLWREIRQWARDDGPDATIWTDLAPDTPWPFSVDRAVQFFRHELEPELVADAKRYVTTAPEEVATDLRQRLRAEGLLSSDAEDA